MLQGGQAQRIVIAVAIALKPDVLLLVKDPPLVLPMCSFVKGLHQKLDSQSFRRI